MKTFAVTIEEGKDSTSSNAVPRAWNQLLRSVRRTERWIVAHTAGLLREWNHRGKDQYTVMQLSDWELRDMGLVREAIPPTAHRHLWI